MNNPSSQYHILLVEDDASLAEWICDYLVSHGYRVTHLSQGNLALPAIKEQQPDLVLLDVMLPLKSGFDICREARDFFRGPILMLTALGEEADEVLGLELGANDYLTKPIKPRILLARIKALLRREQADSVPSTQLQFGQLTICAATKSVFLEGESIPITSNEFDVLWLLASEAGTVISRESLVTQLRGIEYDGLDRSIDLRISRLRKKLRDNTEHPFRIKTVWAKGYLFAADAWQGDSGPEGSQ